MRYLKVMQPGLYLDLTGCQPTRTPSEIDITNCDLNTILIELRKYGIDRFEIVNTPKIEAKSNQNDVSDYNRKYSKIKEKGNKRSNIKNNDVDYNELTTKFDRLENLLQELVELNKSRDNTTNEVIKSDSKKKDDEPEIDEEFIPEVNLSGFKYNK